MSLIDTIGNKLNELNYPTQWQLRPDQFPSITYSIVAENDNYFTTDGKETEYIVQVDVWSKDDYTNIVKNVIARMNEIDMYKDFAIDDYEDDTQVYHKIIRFNYLESEE